MGTGYIRVQVSAGDEALPIAEAEVTIKQKGESLYKTFTDGSGRTEDFALPAPCYRYTLCPHTGEPTYSLCDIEVRAAGFVTQYIKNIEIFDTQTAILPVHLEPLADERYPAQSETLDVEPNGQTYERPCPIREASPARSRNEVIIPDYITVHLGRPDNTAAKNVRVPFTEYIKNVTSSEIYATWPEQSLRANIHAIVTFALNRVYT
ncbi:MAG: SpoIID/LytB domain-containing protein [Oscillospiraceae bacterium]|nr:SpoIID/LytB domain-containing protein [Oscillospiraceae bacterium]